MHAAERGDLESVNLLLTHRAKPDRVNQWGSGALHSAAVVNLVTGEEVVVELHPLRATIFQKYGVAAYFFGHDHDLQHLEFEGVSTSFVVSGGGGASITKLKKPVVAPMPTPARGLQWR